MATLDANTAPLLFLSHAGADAEAARQLKARLEAAGLRVWFDKDDLRAGEKWRPQLEEALRRATAFAVYVGSKGVMNWVEAEVDLALSRAISGQGHFPFIPILAAGTEGSGALPGFARQFQGVRDVENKPEEFKKLVAAVLGRDEAGTLELEKEPFFGLKAIDETRSHLFFGRERETQELVERLGAAGLLMVTGDSGSGKSSLVRAGLVPRWRGGALAELKGQRADNEIWHVIETRPRSNPRRALSEAVNDAAQRLDRSLSDRGTLKEWAITGDIEKVRDALRCDLQADRTRTLLVVDQFEELWTLTPPEQRRPYVDLLLGLADPKDEAFAVVLTMRRDYYNLTSEFPDLHRRLEAHDRQARFLLGRMQDENLRRIVTEPLKLANVDPGEREALAQAVLKDVGARPGDLALVQFALTETWRLKSKYGDDLLQAYVSSEIGRVEGALARAAERVYEQVLRPNYAESEIEAVFIRLVRLGDTGGALRRLARRREFDERRWAMVQTLANEEGNRLVLISGAEGDERAEIAHEALVTQWPRFQRWLQAGAGDKRTLDVLIERTVNWVGAHNENAKRDRLATGADREVFTQLAEVRSDWLSADEQAFVEASNAEYALQVDASRKRIYRTRVAAMVFAALSIIAALAGLYGYKQSTVATLRAQEAVAAAEKEKATAVQARLNAEEARAAKMIADERAAAEEAAKLQAAAEGRRALIGQSRFLAALANQAAGEGKTRIAILLALEALPHANDLGRPYVPEAEIALHTGILAHREKAVLTRDDTQNLIFSPDGNYVITLPVWPSPWDPDAAIVRNVHGEELVRLQHQGSVVFAEFSLDGRSIATASRDGTARIWNLQGRQLAVMRHEEKSEQGGGAVPDVYTAVFSSDGSRVLTAAQFGRAYLWDTFGNQLAALHHEGDVDVHTAAFSPDGKLIVTASSDKTARIWNVEGRQIAILRHDDDVHTAAFSPDGKLIVTASGDKTARIWNVEGRQIAILRHDDDVHTAAFSSDGKLIVTASSDKTARIWNVEGRQIAILRHEHASATSSVFSPNGSIIVTIFEDGTAQIWDVSGRQIATLQQRGSSRISAATFSSDGTQVMTFGHFEVHVWDVGGRLLTEIHPGDEQVFNSVALLPNGKGIVTATKSSSTGGSRGVARIWDITGQEIIKLHDGGNIDVVAVSPDGAKFIAAIDSSDGTKIQIWDTAGNKISVLDYHDRRIYDVPFAVFSPDGRHVVTGSRQLFALYSGEAHLWDARGYRLLTLHHDENINSAAFSPDGEIIATSSHDRTVALWKWQNYADLSELIATAERLNLAPLTTEERNRYFLQ